MSPGIDNLLSIARDLGFNPAHSQTGQWAKAYVYGFLETMPEAVREAGSNDPTLSHFSYSGDPHNRSNAGFIDENAKVAIEFAREGLTR